MNLPYFLLNSLCKMSSNVQNTIGDQYHIILHHGLVKILVKYQLSFIGKTWDQFLDENGFGQNEVWPSVRPKTRQKRRWPRGSESTEEKVELNPKDLKVENLNQSIGLEDELIEDKTQIVGIEVSNNVQLAVGNQVLDKRSEGLVQT